MSRNVELPDDVYARVEQHAAAAGMTVVEWIAAGAPRLVQGTGEQFEGKNEMPQDQQETRTMADRLAGRIGTMRSGRSDLSERGRELFIEGLLEKKRMGRL
jgi:hypothetical protein